MTSPRSDALPTAGAEHVEPTPKLSGMLRLGERLGKRNESGVLPGGTSSKPHTENSK
ncbi:MAG: hypothetical protein JWR10_2454 [Rubritepida sp.]|nr:hypothetical protein [Rubritepida sp.]